MRPMTETRKQRNSESQLLANKRLSNGYSKTTDHVTTRSQAKFETSLSRPSSPRKVSLSNQRHLTIEERRLTISMRLRHEEKKATQFYTQNSDNSHRLRNRTFSSHIPHLSTGFSKIKPTKVFNSFNSHQNQLNTKSNLIRNSSDEDLRKSEVKHKSKKRKSALWVLNCEAEEFLFGETAAEDQEVELPPIDEPPKKRRRMRTTELGDLLKETPLLESKLRNSHDPHPERQSRNPKRRTDESKNSQDNLKNFIRVNRKLGSKLSTPSDEEVLIEDTQACLESECILDPYGLMVGLSSPVSQTDPSLIQSASVRIERILQSLKYTFSFEKVPTSEVWYRTFLSQNKPRWTFSISTDSPAFLLPYEVKEEIKGNQKRIRRPPRKSPRCHASTQAILSALKPSRSGRIPIISSTLSSIPATKVRTTLSPLINHLQNITFNPITNIPSSTTPEVVSNPSTGSLIPPNTIQNGMKANDLSATQYLWDSIQFLSDPYVMNILSLHHRHLPPKSPPRLVSPATNIISTVSDRNPRRTSYKDPLSIVIPKTSPRLASQSPVCSPNRQSLTNGHCHHMERRGSTVLSPVIGRTRSVRSPISGTLGIQIESNSSKSNLRKSPRRMECAYETRKLSAGSTKVLSPPTSTRSSPSWKFSPMTWLLTSEVDEVIFTRSSESLPDFPWETF